MSGFVLNEYQSACRAAHEQAQLLEDLYGRLVESPSREGGRAFCADERAAELRRFRELLSRMLQEENLLPKQPDPEREELLELLAEVKELFSADQRAAVSERLITEEYGLLRLGEQIEGQRHSRAIGNELEKTRSAIERLKRLQQSGPAG
jgi:hypothetical protein